MLLKTRPSAQQNQDVGRLVELDSIRGIAALWVYAYHVWQFCGSPALSVSWWGFSFDALALTLVHHGPAGVDLFMVLSGFCLFWPLALSPNQPWKWQEYAARRARRILPAYYAAIAYAILVPVGLVFLVRQIGWQANTQPLPSLWQVVSHLTLTHTFFRETWDGITGAFWSMGLEAQFYATFPLLVMAWRRFQTTAILGAAFLSLLFRLGAGLWMKDADSLNSFLVSITFLGRWMQFAAGMGAALWVSRVLKDKRDVAPVTWIGLCLASLTLIYGGISGPFLSGSVVPWRDLCLAGGYSLLLCNLCTSPVWLKTVFIKGPLPELGRISYSFFLIHQPTSWYLMELFRKKWGFTGLSQLCLGYTVGTMVTLVISGLFFRAFEKPFLGSIPSQKRIQNERLRVRKSLEKAS